MTINAVNRTMRSGSGGVLSPVSATVAIFASRTSGVSPCTVIFDACDTVAVTDGSDFDTRFQRCGYRWDFDDPGSGAFATTGNSKNTLNCNEPIVAHTFEVADGAGATDFDVLCRIKDPSGNEILGSVTVTVTDQATAYSAANTIAVSNTLNVVDDWSLTSYDRNVPSGTTNRLSSLSSINWDNIVGKRILLKRGDDFSGDGAIPILMGNNDCVISWFGDEVDGRPEVGIIRLGVATSGSSNFAPSDANVSAAISSFGSGNNGFCEDITIDGCRASHIELQSLGSKNIGFHNIDCDQSASSSSSAGSFNFEAGRWAWDAGTNLTASNGYFPEGIYISDCTFKGSSGNTGVDNRALVNIGGFTDAAPTLWCVIGTTCSNADEHNIRVQGMRAFTLHDNDIQGNHYEDGKACITVRPEGRNQVGIRPSEIVGQSRADFSMTASLNNAAGYGCIASNLCDNGDILSDGDSGNASAYIVPRPINTSQQTLITHVSVFNNTLTSNGSRTQGALHIQYAGRYIVGSDNTAPFGQFKNAGDTFTSMNNGPNNVVIDGGTPTTVSNYLEPNSTNLTSTGSTYARPVPTAPR